MKKYWTYFKYTIEHKINVFKECWKVKEYKHAFTHDLSKFRPSEFIPYAKYFHGEKTAENKLAFEQAWVKHYKRNKHHPEHFLECNSNMGKKNIRHMVCDLKAMSRKFGGSAQEYYLSNYYKWRLRVRDRIALENELGLKESKMLSKDACWATIEEIIISARGSRTATEEEIRDIVNEIFSSVNKKYNVNTYDLVIKSAGEVE